jgi:phosphatidylserine/phosphatidylglycerophosphate/cardiolipin synthase-like enzyme
MATHHHAKPPPDTPVPDAFTAQVGRWLPGDADVAFDRAAFTLVMETLETAEQSIDVEVFLIGGEIGLRVLRLLDAKARSGVPVRLLHREGLSIVIGHRLKRLFLALDAESRRHPEHHYTPMVDALFAGELAGSPIRRAGFPLRAFRHGPRFLRLAHDKLIVVDRRVAIIGGMNLATAVAGNHDLLLRVRGAAVEAPAATFDDDWRLATGEPADGAVRAAVAAEPPWSAAPAQLRFLVTRPGCDGHRDAVAALIDGAQRRLWLEMFYLTEPRLIGRLIAAHCRGVDVRIVVDANEYSIGMRLYGAPNIGWLGDLLGAGVPLRQFRSRPGTQMHQKSMLIDDDLVYVGATNFTCQSFLANTESSFAIRSAELARTFAGRFETAWCRDAAAPDAATLGRRRAWAWLVRRLSPLI